MEITEERIKEAYKVADKNGKKMMDALFGNDVVKPTPSLDDYTTIRSYEDALEALGEKGLNMDSMNDACVPSHIIALIKLETISRALWGRDFEPVPDANGDEMYNYPWFAFWTKEEIEENKDRFKKHGALLFGSANLGAGAGFGSLHATYRSSSAAANPGFRLCQENKEKAEYFGKVFIRLWAEYLAFKFTVGGDYFGE